MATMSAREFNRDVSAAKRAADKGAVVITDHGEPAYVLMSIRDYRRLGESGASLVERLSVLTILEVEIGIGRLSRRDSVQAD
ncbi:type II toxin-antitoxin system Phd/YefM family antitoxin [Kribbia dieselivorans]|uniref:type II toxin-antitoxin system Phd/YefM family antitoxin n=1 Tax=Kribbia dieselivorans TaxID=331526 RepID=UPI0008387C14|nr:type II toxin-antitoxin system Phd/YefM family antitoxin [Kribbia dieselivorans]